MVVLYDAYLLGTKWYDYFTNGYVDKEIIVFIETRALPSFIEDYFGFHHDGLPIFAAILIIYPLVLAFLFCILYRKAEKVKYVFGSIMPR